MPSLKFNIAENALFFVTKKLYCVTRVEWHSRKFARVRSLFILGSSVSVFRAVYVVIFLQSDYLESSRILLWILLLFRQSCVQFTLQATRPLKDYPRNTLNIWINHNTRALFQLFRSHKMDLLALLRLFTAGNEISLPFRITLLMKCLPFHISEAWKKVPLSGGASPYKPL